MSTAIRRDLAAEITDYARRMSTKTDFHDDFYVDFKKGGEFREKAIEVAYQIFDYEVDGARLSEREEDDILRAAAKTAVEFVVCVDMDDDDDFMRDATNGEIDRIAKIIDGVEDIIDCTFEELKVTSTRGRREPRDRDRDTSRRRDVRDRGNNSRRDRGESRRDRGNSRRDRNDHGARRNRLNLPAAAEPQPPAVSEEVRRPRPSHQPEEAIRPAPMQDRYLFQSGVEQDHPDAFSDFHAPDGQHPFPTVYQSSLSHAVYVVGQKAKDAGTNTIFIKSQDFIDKDSEEGIELTRIGKIHEEYLVFRRQDSEELDDLQAGLDLINSLVPAKSVLAALTEGNEVCISTDLTVKYRFVTIGTMNDNVELSPLQIRSCVPDDVEINAGKDIISVMSRRPFEHDIRMDSAAGKVLTEASTNGKPNLSGLHNLLHELRPIIEAEAWFELNQAITVEVNSLLANTLGVGVTVIDSFYLDWNSLEAHLSENYGPKLTAAVTGQGKRITDQMIRYIPIEIDVAPEGEEPVIQHWLTNSPIDLVTAIPIKSNDLDLSIANAGKIGMVSSAVTPRLYTALSSLLDIKDRLTLRRCYMVTRDRVAVEISKHTLTDSILIKIL